MVVPGTIIVAFSSWLYLANPAAATRSSAGPGRDSCKTLGVLVKVGITLSFSSGGSPSWLDMALAGC